MAKTRAEPDSSKMNKTKTNKRKRAKSLLSRTAAAAAMKSANPAKENPFETIWSRRKFDILGKKRKGEERRIGLSRSLAIEKRKKTLLKDYEESAKSSKFVDKRIGEQDDTLKEFDKAVLRLQRERLLKLKRARKYDLSDGEDDDIEVHQTQTLSERDDFEEEIPLDDDDKGHRHASRHLNMLDMPHSPETALLDEEEKAPKSKKQVMQEIILKSKYYKAQKAKDREEDEHLMEKLDKDFESLAQSEALLSLMQPNKMNALKALLNKNDKIQTQKEGSFGSTIKEPLDKEKRDAYDKLVKEMVMDSRARPSDRRKTPEEIAQEERERLEKLEEERQKRMLAHDDSSDDVSDDDEDIQKMVSKRSRSISGDDLGDSFSFDQETANKKGWVDGIFENKDVNDDDEEDGTSSDDSETNNEDDDDDDDASDKDDSSGHDLGDISMRDWEQSDDDDLTLDAEEEEKEEEAEDVNEREIKLGKKIREEMQRKGSQDTQRGEVAGKMPPVKDVGLPFVIEAPNSLEELCLLLDNRSETEVIEAINRIRACNSIRLAAENRKKMQVFYGVLLQYFAVLATRSPLNLKLINSLVKPLIEMSTETPYFAAICARQRLIHIRNRLCEDIKIPGKSSWPSLKTLLLLRLWSLIFPCSDFRHVVMTPTLVLMCEYLMRCRIESGRDIVVGSFLCSLVLLVTKQSRKFCPEAITFLQTLLVSCMEFKRGSRVHSQLINHLLEHKTQKPWLLINDRVSELNHIDFLRAMDMRGDSPYFFSNDFKASVIASVVETLKGFVSIYDGLSSFPEIFLPISTLLLEILENPNIPDLLKDNLRDVIDLIREKVDELHMLRRPLQMRKQKPVPIKLLNPKFEENYVKGIDYDPDRERVERKKLKKRLKSEKKGAVRELRKDNYFLSEVKERSRIEREQERAEQYGRAMDFLQKQEHAFKSGQLGKGRKRRK
ncbi:nucleolar protein 14 [Ananas comosus]|uniref:Nucleolar protein 14 n=1 Tax=Ananas comosus TaxID=4615 RepID=A0A6P5FDB7_ANACO|nr:nucleolar protein 14 [Ananas comosus]